MARPKNGFALMKRGGASGEVLIPSEMVNLDITDLQYVRGLVRKDLEYLRRRRKKRAFKPQKGHTDADATKVAWRAKLEMKLNKLLEEV
jgi:hypothetical protein